MYRKGYSRRCMAALLSASLVLSSAPGVYAAEETETAVTEAVVQESTAQSEAAAEGAKQSEAAPQENTEQNTVGGGRQRRRIQSRTAWRRREVRQHPQKVQRRILRRLRHRQMQILRCRRKHSRWKQRLQSSQAI